MAEGPKEEPKGTLSDNVGGTFGKAVSQGFIDLIEVHGWTEHAIKQIGPNWKNARQNQLQQFVESRLGINTPRLLPKAAAEMGDGWAGYKTEALRKWLIEYQA